jgi:hypothetical protein
LVGEILALVKVWASRPNWQSALPGLGGTSPQGLDFLPELLPLQALGLGQLVLVSQGIV